MRKAVALHVIEKNETDGNLTCLDMATNLWETKYWVIGKSTREELVGGKVFVHTGQKNPSHIGGKIQKIYHPEEADKKRYSVVFHAENECKGVITPPKGWGNERKIEWQEI